MQLDVLKVLVKAKTSALKGWYTYIQAINANLQHMQPDQHHGGQDESQIDNKCAHHIPVAQGSFWLSKHAWLPLLTCTEVLSVSSMYMICQPVSLAGQ